MTYLAIIGEGDWGFLVGSCRFGLAGSSLAVTNGNRKGAFLSMNAIVTRKLRG